jgi:predicted DNA-binding transcriptional regulator YafY
VNDAITQLFISITMDRTERFYKIDQMINERRLVPFKDLQDELEVSRATLKRDPEYMRNRLIAPIVWDRDAGGYRFDKTSPSVGGQYESPGLWFNSTEAHALLTMQHLLARRSIAAGNVPSYPRRLSRALNKPHIT